MTLFGYNNTQETFEFTILGFRAGWTVLLNQNSPDYAIMFHMGFLNPGITIMLSWRRYG